MPKKQPSRTRKLPRNKANAQDATLRVQWGLYNHTGRQIELFPYARRREAYEKAARLRDSTGQHHYVQRVKTGMISIY